jgi:hypothetical protein
LENITGTGSYFIYTPLYIFKINFQYPWKIYAALGFRDVTKPEENLSKRRKIPHPSRKNIIIFRSNPKHLVFSKSNQIGGIPLKGRKITSLARIG